jgi:MFS family permease
MSSRSLAAVRAVVARPDLRRLQLAGAAAFMGQWCYWVVVVLYAYAHGGAVAVGVIGALRLGGAAIASPFAGVIADRYPRRRVLITTDCVRTACLVLAAIADATDAPRVLVFAPALLFSLAGSAFRPALSAYLPTLAATPEELTAANVTASAIESTSIFAGPAVGGLVSAAWGTSVGFAVAAAAMSCSAFLISRIQAREKVTRTAEAREPFLREAGDGLRAISSNRNLSLIVGLLVMQTLVAGAFGVVTVVLAKTTLGAGSAGVGYLQAAIGVGGIAGTVVSLSMIGRRGLASVLGIGVALWGLPLVVIAAAPSIPLALAMLGIVGIGNTVVDVSGFTLLQRAVPDSVLARVNGVLESLILSSIAAGSLIAPFVIDWVGVRWTCALVGLVLPTAAAVRWPALRRLDTAPGAQLGERLRLIARVPMLAPLPPPQQEAIAHELEETDLPAGTTLFQAGDPGDRFWIVASGEISILPPGETPVTVGAGEAFGEIALLRDVPRTASATAVVPTRLYALDRDQFVAAVTGHAESSATAEATIAARIGTLRPTALAL